MATTIVLVRHGETDWNREHRFQGHSDTALNEAGRRQAQELARQLDGEPLLVAYTSPLARARETADILGGALDLDVRHEEALKEIDVGSWSGLTTEEVARRYPDGYRRWLDSRIGWEDGESYDDLGRRVVAGLIRIAHEHPDSHVLAVTHGGPIRSIWAVAMGLPFDGSRSEIGFIENCAVVRIAIRDGTIEAVD